MDNIEILCKLDKGQISIDEALALIKKNQKLKKTTKGRFIKISIKDGEKRFPVIIPLCLLSSGFSLSKAVIRLLPKDKRNETLDGMCNVLEKINDRDFARLVDALRYSKPYPLVKVEDDDTIVDISII
ncbi:MAG: hypothetical protein GX024_03910 [Clostridiales bacterium]|nr:hypothetical protein [Clostridiales bacterium]